MERQRKIELGMFLLLVTFGVVGRWAQPDWNVTPLAAVAIFAGYFFRNVLLAMLAPLSAMLVSNLLLPAYGNQGVMLLVYGMFLLPALLGRWVRGQESYTRLAIAGMVPAVLFFLVSNGAVWMFEKIYEPTLAGLLQCYVAGLPFFRGTLLGDLFFLAVIFGSYACACQYGLFGKRELARVVVKK